ncbi:MAG: UDP-N-acetylmuramoyl-L-alanyl-D-glutamate--2,6-diaminopimelate ligase, partial [Bacteroidales bacterium]|nr:UDP-N-acetylmuramoyl-L-alanyl-D-glutamate--2,6-diaminopimelate ligase [Bacteroidales bacterium]
MKIKETLKNVETLGNTPQGEVSQICCDSRKCTAGSLFVAVRGAEADGHAFIGKAIENGAKYIVCEEIPQENAADAEFITVKESRKAVAQIAANFYDNPSRKLKVVAVTGTNGKTSIATLLYNLFTDLGYSCGLLSTIANYVGSKKYEAVNTTPGPMELNALLAQMSEEGCEYCFMEASSHAIHQQRTEGIEFTGAIFTNLTHDHLDYHKTFANYLACKKQLFDTLPATAFALTNIDDRNGEVMLQNTKAQKHTYSCRNWADFKVRILEKTIEGMLLNINGKEVWCRFIGMHNAANLTAVYGAAMLLGGKEDEVITAMSRLTSVAGRLEYFKGEDEIIAAVDYAHTPDALENVLKTLKELEPCGDLVCVFGCGGNRDKTKRPEMGAIATKYSTRVVVTSDNPRFEDPNEIIAD